jgi:hypothetical protein
MRNCRASVGWPTNSTAHGVAESISALVSSRNCSSCSGVSRCASSTTSTTRRRRSCSSAASRLCAWTMSSAMGRRGCAPSAPTILHVQAARTERWCGDVDDVVRGRIELAGGRADGHGLADADLAGDDAQQRLADTEANARHRLLVAGTWAQLGGWNRFGKWHTTEAEVRNPRHARHSTWSSSSGSWWCGARSRKAIEPKCSASCLANTSPR